jgi:hypothetical protein
MLSFFAIVLDSQLQRNALPSLAQNWVKANEEHMQTICAAESFRTVNHLDRRAIDRSVSIWGLGRKAGLEKGPKLTATLSGEFWADAGQISAGATFDAGTRVKTTAKT